MSDTEYDRHLHLVGVGEDKSVLSTVPTRVKTERIDMAIVLASTGAVVVEVPTRVEQVKGLGEDVVIDEASVDSKGSHEQDDVTTAAIAQPV